MSYTYPNYNLPEQKRREQEAYNLSPGSTRSGQNYTPDWHATQAAYYNKVQQGGKRRSKRAHSKRRAHRKSHRRH